jgi:hypothetical protein
MSVTAPAAAGGSQPKALVIDLFDGHGPKLGRSWEIYKDENNLGTKVDAFAFEKAANPKGFQGHGHFSGHMGKSKDPWPWAVLDLAFEDDGPKDLSGYKALRFWVKGDGKKYRVRLGRTAIEDYCYPEIAFVAPKEWTLVVLPLSDFKQPSWGKQVAAGFKDVTMVGFCALAPGDDEDFDLRFTGVEFIAELPAQKK